LAFPEQLVDTYLELGFRSLFLRPMSPHGFAGKTRRSIGYDMNEFVAFYEKVLAYLLKLNANGIEITEVYSSILLRHILTPFVSNYVDLRSPAGAGFAVLVYNYDGQVALVIRSSFPSLQHLSQALCSTVRLSQSCPSILILV
jgi:hypothetical protein